MTITAIGAPDQEPDPQYGSTAELRSVLDRLSRATNTLPIAPAPGGEFSAAAALVLELTARAIGAAMLRSPREAQDTMRADATLCRRQDDLLSALRAYSAELQRVSKQGIE